MIRKEMVKEHSSGPMEISMKGNGRMRKYMGKAHLPGPMETSMSENGRMRKGPV